MRYVTVLVSLSSIASAFARSRTLPTRSASNACVSAAVELWAIAPTVTMAASGLTRTVASPVVTIPGGTRPIGTWTAGEIVVACAGVFAAMTSASKRPASAMVPRRLFWNSVSIS